MNDREIYLTAVQENGAALAYASSALRNDREIALAAVNQTGAALKYASENLRSDPHIVAAAIGNKLYSCCDWIARENYVQQLRRAILAPLCVLRNRGEEVDFTDNEAIQRYACQWVKDLHMQHQKSNPNNVFPEELWSKFLPMLAFTSMLVICPPLCQLSVSLAII